MSTSTPSIESLSSSDAEEAPQPSRGKEQKELFWGLSGWVELDPYLPVVRAGCKRMLPPSETRKETSPKTKKAKSSASTSTAVTKTSATSSKEQPKKMVIIPSPVLEKPVPTAPPQAKDLEKTPRRTQRTIIPVVTVAPAPRPESTRPIKIKTKKKKRRSNKPVAQGSYDMSEYAISTKDITDHDVLFGRGNGCSSHKGNCYFREYVLQHRDAYTGTNDRNVKVAAAQRVIDQVVSRGGRFIEAHPVEVSKWRVVEEARVYEKTSQALRETHWKNSRNGSRKDGGGKS